MLKKKNSFSKTNIIIAGIILVIIAFMGTGYAVLSQVLDINGSTKLDIPDYKIYVYDVQVLSTKDGGYATSSPIFTDNSVALYTELPDITSEVVYEITIKNTGNSNVIVDYLHTASSNWWTKFEIDGVNATETIPRLSVQKIKITVSAAEMSSSEIEMDSYIILNFAFLKETDSYSNACTVMWDGASSTEPVSTNILGVDYYQLSDANEFKWFMDQINSGNTTINGMLTNNICLNDNTITPIGTDNAYVGILDGQNRSISGISFSRDIEIKSSNTDYNVGFFMNNSGYLKNLHVTGNYYDKQYVSTRKSNLNLGGIAVNNTGIIENVSFNGSIELNVEAHVNCTARAAHTINYIGGIVTNNIGVVRGSYNNATFNLTGSTTSTTCNIYNRSSRIYAGGIVSLNSGYVSDSYNKANMNVHCYNEHSTGTTNISEIGGVVGHNWTSEVDGLTYIGSVTNSYNSGTIAWTRDGTGSFDHFTDTVAVNEGGTISNVYLVSGTAENEDGTYLSTVVSAGDLMDLNSSINLGAAFKKDNLNINGGYPVLFWQPN